MDVADRSSLPRRLSPSGERATLPRSADGLPPLGAEFHAILDAGLAAIPLELATQQRAAIEAHVRLLLAWNAHINLSGLRTAEQIARGHVLDALIAIPFLRSLRHRAGEPTLLDLGSGGGYPGLPLAVALPARRVALVDSIAKKAAFLEAAAAVVSEALPDSPGRPEISVLAERAEDLADEPGHREGWDVVVARAVGSVAEVAELGLPLVRPGGRVVVWKRTGDANQLKVEMEAARRISQAAGGRAPRSVPLDAATAVGLPGHCLVVIAKTRATPERYPRAPGERRRAALP